MFKTENENYHWILLVNSKLDQVLNPHILMIILRLSSIKFYYQIISIKRLFVASSVNVYHKIIL